MLVLPGTGLNTCITVAPSCNTIAQAVTASANGDTIQIGSTLLVLRVEVQVGRVNTSKLDQTKSDMTIVSLVDEREENDKNLHEPILIFLQSIAHGDKSAADKNGFDQTRRPGTTERHLRRRRRRMDRGRTFRSGKPA